MARDLLFGWGGVVMMNVHRLGTPAALLGLLLACGGCSSDGDGNGGEDAALSFDSETSGTVEPFDPLFDLPPLPKSRPFGLVPVFNNEGETVNPYGAGLFPGASGSLFAGIVEGVTLYEEESAVLPTSSSTCT